MLGLSAALLCSPAMADTKSSNHTLNAGPDIWRIELRNADQLRQIVSGDSGYDGSEIRNVAWILASGDQYHKSELSAAELQSIALKDFHKGSYVYLANGWQIGARIPEVSKGTQLWVHAQQYDAGGGKPVLRFSLETHARDLDCAGTRVCRRGDTGVQKINVTIDLPPVRSFACNQQNTIRLGVVGEGIVNGPTGPQATTQPVKRPVPVMYPEGKPEAKSVGERRAALPNWGGVLSINGSHFINGPILTPVLNSLDDVTICIASSTRT